MQAGNSLPLRAQHRLKRALQYLDYSQHSKGLKIVEELLRQHPLTPLLLSIQSLFLFYTEGYIVSIPIGEEAIRLDPTDVGNWVRLGRQHVERWEYVPALRCYRHIVALEPQNRELKWTYCKLLLQNGCYEETAEVAFSLWKEDKRPLEGWIYCILGLYLTAKCDKTAQFIDKFLSERGENLNKYQISELISAKIHLFLTNNRISDANLAFSSESHLILDPFLRFSYLFRIQIGQSHISEAISTCKSLISLNPEQLSPIKQLISLSLEPERELIQGLMELYPESETLAVYRLETAGKEEISGLLIAYLQGKITLKTPAISTIFKRLMPIHKPILHSVVQKVYISLSQTHSFPTNPLLFLTEDVLAWGFYACSRFFYLVNDLISSQDCIEKAISYLPRTGDFLLFRSKLLRRGNDLLNAVKMREMAREMDPRDRYINYRCAVYHLLRNDIETANAVIAPFSVDEDSPGLQIRQNQEVHYELKLAEAWERLGNSPAASEQYLEVEEQLRDMSSVTYRLDEEVIQRLSIITYAEALEACSNVFHQKVYIRTVKGILRTAPEMKDMNRNQTTAVAEMVKRVICTEDRELQDLLFTYLMRENRVFLCLKIANRSLEPFKTDYFKRISAFQAPHFTLVLNCFKS